MSLGFRQSFRQSFGIDDIDEDADACLLFHDQGYPQGWAGTAGLVSQLGQSSWSSEQLEQLEQTQSQEQGMKLGVIPGSALDAAARDQAPNNAAAQGSKQKRGHQSSKPKAVQRPRGGRRHTTVAQQEAHKRYREKKKQNIAMMEMTVQTKRQELEHLQAENEQLKRRARVLEIAQRCSIEIHELMKLLDGLQGLDLDVENANGSSSCCSTLAQGIAPKPEATAVSATAATPGSTVNGSKGMLNSCTTASSNVDTGCTAAGSNTCSSFLQHLMQEERQHQTQQQLAAVQEQQQPLTKQEPAMMSLQPESHWMLLAQQCVEAAAHQNQLLAAPAAAAAVAATDSASGIPQQPQMNGAPAAAAAAAGLTRPAGVHGASGNSDSSTRESSGSLLTDVGSVDTAEQGLVIYKAFLQRAAEMLAKAHQEQQLGELEAAAATEEQVGELARSTISRLQPFLVARGQGVVYDWNTRNLETQLPEEPPADLWAAVVDALHLSPETQQDALECFELFGGPLSHLLAERKRLTKQYRAVQAAGAAAASGASISSSRESPAQEEEEEEVEEEEEEEEVCTLAAARTFETVAPALIASMTVLRQLAANLERYQCLDGVFAHSLTNLLTGAQIAAACVASYPYLPRWHSMMACLQQRKRQEQHELEQQQQQQQPPRRSSRTRALERLREVMLV